MIVDRIGQRQRRQHVLADRLPRVPVQQMGARVSPPQRRRREHIPHRQRPVQRLQHAHHISVAVHRALRERGVGEHRPLPRRCHQGGVDLLRQQRLARHLAAGQVREPPHCRQDLPAARRRAQRLGFAEELQERADGVVLVDQRRPQRGLRRAVIVGDQFLDGVERGQHLFLGRPGLVGDRRPQCRRVQIGVRLGDQVELLHQHPPCLRQQPGGLLQLRQHRQPVAAGLASRRADQPRGHQQREQVERVVDRFGLQRPGHRHQGRRPPRLQQASQQRSLAARPVPGQGLHPPDRHLGDLDPPQLEPGDVIHPVQRPHQLRTRLPLRCLPQPLQLREPRSLRDLQQPQQRPRKTRIGPARLPRHRRVQALIRLFTDTADQPLQHRHPGSSTRWRRNHATD